MSGIWQYMHAQFIFIIPLHTSSFSIYIYIYIYYSLAFYISVIKIILIIQNMCSTILQEQSLLSEIY